MNATGKVKTNIILSYLNSFLFGKVFPPSDSFLSLESNFGQNTTTCPQTAHITNPKRFALGISSIPVEVAAKMSDR